MSHSSPPTPSHRDGFSRLDDTDYIRMQGSNDIPMTTVRTDSSGNKMPEQHDFSQADLNSYPTMSEKPKRFFSRKAPGGKRKLKKLNSRGRVGSDGEEESTNAMGKFYNKVINSSVVTRYLLYVLPVAALIAIPLAIFGTTAHDDYIGGVRAFWLLVWMEVLWISLWVSKLFAKVLPSIFMFLSGVVSSGTRKYALVIKNMEIPISLVAWAVIALTTFTVLTSNSDNDPKGVGDWVGIMKKILAATLIGTLIYLGEKFFIQLISISYHQRSFDGRIKESKRNVFLLGLLYDASRTLFPMYCQEFAEEDYLINDTIEAMISNGVLGHSRKISGSTTPLRLIGEIGRLGDKVTSVFGNIASEISGKEVFNPHSAHSIIVEALEKKRSSEALAKRIWMSFVVEGSGALTLEDVREVLGPARQDEADEAFAIIDADGNGDISLDEMIMKVVEIGRDRKAINNSMKDIGQAIGVLDSILAIIVFVVVVFIYVGFLNTNFVTTLATAGTTLLSLSFVFAVTTQEFLGSCIFLFVKHPYDVGDRVDIVGPGNESLVVEQISLLYTVFKRIDCMKMVQVPNIVLNNLWIENVTRSNAMKEQLDLFISFDTSLEDIEALRTEMEAFVRDPENSRDFQSDVILECTGVGSMDKLQLRVEIRHKSNWSNESVRSSRRSKFMCALVLALRKVPIYAPGGGGSPLGDPANPTYSVAVSDEIAAAAREKASKAKEEKRLIPTKKPSTSSKAGKGTGLDASPLGTPAENIAAEALNARKPTDDSGLGDWGDKSEETVGPADAALERQRSNEIENLRQGLLKRESTHGRRRPGVTIPSAPSSEGPGFMVTPSSPRMGNPNPNTFDEEANVGGSMAGAMYSGAGYGNSGGNVHDTYTAFPPAGRGNNQNLTQQHSAPAASQAPRPRDPNANQNRRY